MLSLLQAVTNSGGSGLIKEVSTTGSIKSAFGAIGANLLASFGSIGVEALAKKALGPAAAANYTPAAQRQLGTNLSTLPPAQNTKPPSAWKQYKPALIVGAVGLAIVVGAYAWHRG